MIDHVDLRVSDFDASLRFYDTVFTALGKERVVEEPGYTDWGDFSILADGRPVAKHVRIAFAAPSEALAGDLRDPDGNRVEAVHSKRTAGAIDHLWLRTRDVAAIRRFYVATGHELGVDEPGHVQIVSDGARISYVAGEPPTEHVHLAFRAGTNEAVDAWHRAAIAAGYADNGPPGERAAYHPGYYGAFVLDPDGHNIEAVNHNQGT